MSTEKLMAALDQAVSPIGSDAARRVLVQAIREYIAEQEQTCEWRSIDNYVSAAACGESAFRIDAAGWTFCPNCGRRIEVKE